MVYLSETSPASTETRASDLSGSNPSVSFNDTRPHVVFVTGAVVAKAFQFAAARRLGLSVIIVDSASSAGPELQKTGDIDLFIPLELSSDVDLATIQVVECLGSLSRNIVGVVTFMEMAVLLTSKVAAALSLPGLNPESVATARDKWRMREAMRTAKLASVASYSVKRREDLYLASTHVGFPAVLKPIIGADSLGVKRVDTVQDLLHAFEEGVTVMHSLRITSGLLSAPSDPLVVSSSPILPVEFLLEEYLDGPEVDVDVLLHEGVCVYAAVSDNGPTIEPYFTETYGVLPSVLPMSSQSALIELSVDSVTKGLHMQSGLFHIEAKLTSRGPRLIEINARLGGGPICEMHKRVSGIDLAEQQIRLSVGLPPDTSNMTCSPMRSFAYMTTNAVCSGTIGSDLSFLQNQEVRKITCRVRPGDRVVGPEDGQPSWLVELWMEDDPGESGRLVGKITKLSDAIGEQFRLNYYRM